MLLEIQNFNFFFFFLELPLISLIWPVILILSYKKVIIGLIYKPRSNLPCHFPPAVSCCFYLPVTLIVLPVENGAILQRVHSWLEDKTSRL